MFIGKTKAWKKNKNLYYDFINNINVINKCY